MNKYRVPFCLEGEFLVGAKDLSDLKKKMDGVALQELISTAVNISISANPDKAILHEKMKKVKIKTVSNIPEDINE